MALNVRISREIYNCMLNSILSAGTEVSLTSSFGTQKNRRTGFPIRRQTVYLPNKSLCVPVRVSVSTSTSFSMR